MELIHHRPAPARVAMYYKAPACFNDHIYYLS
jgi:hypothetical protein